MSESTPWTPETIAALLDRSDQAVERAVVAIFNRQTDDEREICETRHRNGRGFASCHAHLGSYYARWVQSGRRLDGRHLERARKMMRHYTGQLAEVAAAQQPEHAMSA